MKKIIDERLKLKNLKHIRIAHLIQTLGILAILIYESITQGIDTVRGTPLWWVFRLTITVSLFSAVSMSIEHDTKRRSPKKFFIGWLIFALVVSVGTVIIIGINQVGFKTALLAGVLAFIIAIIPGLYIRHLLKIKLENENE